MFKKILILISAVFFLLVVAAVTIPFLVDVDQYRPQIVQQAAPYLNGKLELGKLKLSLWGQIRIEIAGLSITDSKSKKVISVQDAYFHLPFSSILSGSPILVLKLEKPEIQIVKNEKGELNVLQLAKASTASAQEQEASKTAAPSAATTGSKSTTGTSALPGIVANARLTIEFRNARVGYVDLKSGLVNTIEDLNILFEEVSITRPFDLEIWADLKTTLGKSFQLSGPFKFETQITPEIKNAEFVGAKILSSLDLDKLQIEVPGTFYKSASVSAHFKSNLQVTTDLLKIESFDLQFHNANVNAKGTLPRPKETESGATPVKNEPIHFELSSNDIGLAPWSSLIPMLKDYELAGTMKLDAQATGDLAKMDYSALFNIKELSAKAPHLKAKPVFNASVSIKTDQIEKFMVHFMAPANELKIEGKLESFKQPKLQMKIASSGMDLDQLISFPPPAKADAKTAAAPSEGGSKGTSGTAPAADLDKSFDSLRENKMAQATQGNIAIDMAFIKAYDIKIDSIRSDMSLSDLVFSIKAFSMSVFKGKIASSFKLDMKPERPAYDFTASVDHFDMKAAMESQLSMFKNTVHGALDFKMKGQGKSLNSEMAKKNLNATGSFKVANAKFTSIDVGKMALEGINGALQKAAEKIPQLKGKQLGKIGGRECVYESIASNFSISGGKFSMPDFKGIAQKNNGIDLSGRTEVGLIDQNLSASWAVIDTYNYTKAYDVSIDQMGVKVDHILAEKGKAVTFPVTVKGKTSAPEYSYSEVPEHFAKVVAQNLVGGAKSKATEMAKKKVEELKASPQVQEAKQKVEEQVKTQGKDLIKKLWK